MKDNFSRQADQCAIYRPSYLVALIAAELREAWGAGKRTVRFPVLLRIGKNIL